MRESWFRVREDHVYVCSVYRHTVGSDTATVIIRIQEVTNVRVLPPFSVFPRWPDDVGVVRALASTRTVYARPGHGGGGSSGERGRPRAGGSRPAPGCAVRGGAVAAGTRLGGAASALAARAPPPACAWRAVGAGARQGRRLRATLSSDLVLCGRGVLKSLIRSCSLHALHT